MREDRPIWTPPTPREWRWWTTFPNNLLFLAIPLGIAAIVLELMHRGIL